MSVIIFMQLFFFHVSSMADLCCNFLLHEVTMFQDPFRKKHFCKCREGKSGIFHRAYRKVRIFVRPLWKGPRKDYLCMYFCESLRKSRF